MTRRRRWAIAALPALLVLACAEVTPRPHILVSMVPEGTHGSREDGDTLRTNREEMEDQAGIVRGFSVVRGEAEWRALWPSVDTDRIPLLPHGVDFSTSVLFVAVPTDDEATAIRIRHVIDTPENGIHVYVARELVGQGCPARDGSASPVDVVEMPRIDNKEFHVHVETVREDPCTPPPQAKVICKPNASTVEPSERLVIEPGKVVACMTSSEKASRPTVDRTWSFRTLPLGTTAKMTISSDGQGVTFGTDAFGTYELGLSITDDLGRTGNAIVDVDVAPRKDVMVVQMLWTKFAPDDDPSTFPRVELHVTGEHPPAAADVAKYGKLAWRPTPWILVKGDCALDNDKPPPWCTTKAVAETTIEELALDAFPDYRIGVHYVDDRFDGQPVLCVRTFRGSVTGEWCDNHIRAAGNWWDVALVEALTGRAPPPPAPKVTDAGAGEGGASDAGASDGGAAKSAIATGASGLPSTPVAAAARKPAAPAATAKAPTISVTDSKPKPAKPASTAEPAWNP